MSDHCLYFDTTALARSVEREWTVAYAPFSLIPPQRFMLRVVLERPGVLNRELAEVLGIARPTATRLVDGLIAEGLVGRQPSVENGREWNLLPTEAARELETALQAANSKVARRLHEHVGTSALDDTVQAIRNVRSTLNAQDKRGGHCRLFDRQIVASLRISPRSACMITVLVIGIEPFEFDPTNPSWDIAQAPDSTQMDGAIIVARQLLCMFGLANEILVDAIEVTPPALVFALGLATGRTEISVECVAINVIDAHIPDNTDNQLVDTPVVADGPTAYFSALPIKAIVHALCEAGMPAGVSQSASTYNCNHLLYGLMHCIVMRAPQVCGGFIHMPATPELAARHAGRPSLSIDTRVKGIRLAACMVLATQSDLKMSVGAMH